MIAVRVAIRSDARAVAALAESTFRETFAPTNTASDMDLHCQQAYGEQTQSAEIANPRMQTLVAEADGVLIGYAQVRWMDAPSCVQAANPGEIYRLYVASAWHGKGVAAQLMARCLDVIAHQGCDVAWLGVWEHNPRAIAFYTKHGFEVVGEHTFTVGTDPQRDLVMSRRLRLTSEECSPLPEISRA